MGRKEIEMGKYSLVLLCLILFLSCDTGGDDPTPPGKDYIKAEVVTGFLSGWDVDVRIQNDATVYNNGSVMGDSISNAIITANSQALSGTPSGGYETNLSSLNIGDTVQFDISYDGIIVTPSVVIPEGITLIGDSTYQINHDLTTDLTLRWSALSTEPNSIRIYSTTFGVDFDETVTGATTELTIPGGTLTANAFGQVSIIIASINETQIIGGSIHSESVAEARNELSLTIVAQ